MRYYFTLLFALVLFACTAQKTASFEVRVGANATLLLDSATAARTITRDKTDKYFQRVTAVEMSIQMRKPLDNPDRNAWVEPYTMFLRSDMGNFTADEATYVLEVMDEIMRLCQSVSPDILPDSLLIIKAKGKHVGDGVYYTRENLIVVPADVLRVRDRVAFKSTMIHEVFHVYSRLNPEKSAALYRLIGFENIGYDNLRIPTALAERIVHNPDGVNFAQKIELKQTNGSVKQAIPVIYANAPGYQKGKDVFFSYIEFNLYEVEKQKDGSWKVLVGPDGYSSTLNLETQPDFFKQIRDNTGYIIHPDEVLADNFAFLIESLNNPLRTAKFSAEGKQLLKDMETVIRAK
jgi:hypothetical protein